MMSIRYNFDAENLIAQGRIDRNNLETIKAWLKNSEEKYVPTALPDEMIILFLLSCENDIQATKKTITSYFKLKKEAPEIHNNLDCNILDSPPLDIWTVITVPKRTKENYVIHYFKLEDSDYRKYDVLPLFRSALMLIDVSLDKVNPPAGLICITDLGAVGFMHLTKYKMDVINKYLRFIQEAIPIKLHAMHYLNSNLILNKCFSLAKGFMKNDVYNRMYFHSPNLRMEKLHEYIPPECLPKEYGGELPSLKELKEETKQQFREKKDYWNMEEKLRLSSH